MVKKNKILTNSDAKLPFAYAKDGISYTFSIVANALGKGYEAQKHNRMS